VGGTGASIAGVLAPGPTRWGAAGLPAGPGAVPRSAGQEIGVPTGSLAAAEARATPAGRVGASTATGSVRPKMAEAALPVATRNAGAAACPIGSTGAGGA
jgi:hypothetical protein